MKTIEEIRLENLKTLCGQFKSQRQFALHLGRTPEQVNQWLRDSGKPVVSSAAREIEEIMQKPRGWMDNDHARFPLPKSDSQEKSNTYTTMMIEN